jgi:hypothetical protein
LNAKRNPIALGFKLQELSASSSIFLQACTKTAKNIKTAKKFKIKKDSTNNFKAQLQQLIHSNRKITFI